MRSAASLPDGRLGQALAVAVTLAGLVLVWFGLASPLVGWYQQREDTLATDRMAVAHMAALAASLPQLRRRIADIASGAKDDRILLPDNSDALAGADLQSALQGLAGHAGLRLGSTTMLPAQPAGALRSIAISVSLTAPWKAFIALLQAIDTAEPRMVVTELSVASPPQASASEDLPLRANFTVAGFRTGAP
jgi:general secretion pathway protein M